jgi:hypothetical protein
MQVHLLSALFQSPLHTQVAALEFHIIRGEMTNACCFYMLDWGNIPIWTKLYEFDVRGIKIYSFEQLFAHMPNLHTFHLVNGIQGLFDLTNNETINTASMFSVQAFQHISRLQQFHYEEYLYTNIITPITLETWKELFSCCPYIFYFVIVSDCEGSKWDAHNPIHHRLIEAYKSKIQFFSKSR